MGGKRRQVGQGKMGRRRGKQGMTEEIVQEAASVVLKAAE